MLVPKSNTGFRAVVPDRSCCENHPRDITWKFIIVDNVPTCVLGGASNTSFAPQVFSWGENSDGRLGHGLPLDRNGSKLRAPAEIELLREEDIVELACGGYGMWALTSNGVVYGWGRTHEQGSRTLRPKVVAVDNDIVRITAGHTTCLALARSGELYGVKNDFVGAIKLEFSISGHNQKINTRDHPVLHFASGWGLAAAVLTGIGVVVWQEDEVVMERQTELRPAKRIYFEHSVVGFMAGARFLVCLTEEGLVYRVDVSDLFGPSELSPILLNKFVGTQKFTSISGSLWKFGVFNSVGEVFIGDEKTNGNDSPIVLPGLQGQGIVSLSWGDFHHLALCKDGSVFAWGRELSANGCLGLGYADLAAAKDMNLVVENDTIIVHEPRKVAFGENKFVVGIAAGGWHSGALVIDSNRIHK